MIGEFVIGVIFEVFVGEQWLGKVKCFCKFVLEINNYIYFIEYNFKFLKKELMEFGFLGFIF